MDNVDEDRNGRFSGLRRRIWNQTLSSGGSGTPCFASGVRDDSDLGAYFRGNRVGNEAHAPEN